MLSKRLKFYEKARQLDKDQLWGLLCETIGALRYFIEEEDSCFDLMLQFLPEKEA